MKKVTVIGAGTMGNGIAHVFAQSGFSVSLVDVSADALSKAVATITKNLDRMVAKGTITSEIKNQSLKNISTNTSLADGVKGSELVIEAATENMDLKCKIFRDLEAMCSPEVLLATNTSSI